MATKEKPTTKKTTSRKPTMYNIPELTVMSSADIENKNLQKKLKSYGLYQDGQVDGIIGPKTKRALAEYEKMNALKENEITATGDKRYTPLNSGGWEYYKDSDTWVHPTKRDAKGNLKTMTSDEAKNKFPNLISRPKYVDGGPVAEVMTEEEIAASKDKDKLVSGFVDGGIGMVTDLGSGILDSRKNTLLNNQDSRYDPASTLKKANSLDTGSSILSGAGKGAAIGAAGGPVGAAIGAGVGAIVSGIGSMFNKKAKDKEIEAATAKWSAGKTKEHADNITASGYKEGGKITGKGGPKSDNVNMKAENGSFIVPAENSDIGMEIGKTYLGWDDQTHAKKDNGGTDIKVSPKEVFYTPEEVGVLKYYGVNLDSLAPKAKSKIQMKDGGMKKKNNFEDGGWIYDKEKGLVMSPDGRVAYDKDGNEYNVQSATGKLSTTPDKEKTMWGKSIYSTHAPVDNTESPEVNTKEDFERKWYDYAPEAAGIVQAAGSAAGLMRAGEAPDLNVSRTLKKLSGEVRRNAQYGYENQVLNALDSQIERKRRDANNAISAKGGSAQEVLASQQKLLETTLDQKTKIKFADAQEKARKWADVLKVDSAIAGQEFDISKINVDQYYKTQDVFAGMLSAGISNIVGARQLKNEQDTIREIGGTNPTFNR